jgi:hypothetical protein
MLDVRLMDHALEVLRDIEPALADEPVPHLQAVILLGHFLVSRGQVTGNLNDIKEAEPWILLAVSQIDVNDPQWREFSRVLGVAMTVLANLSMDTGHIDRAISFLRAIANQPVPDAGSGAMLRGTLGVLLAQRANFSGTGRDLDEGISEMVASYEMAPPGHPYRAAVGTNLAGALLMRFMERGQAEDVDAARFYLDMTSTLTGGGYDGVPELMADSGVSIIANRGMLRAIDGLRGDAAALNDAVTHLTTALGMIPGTHPHHGRISCDLGFVLALRSMSAQATDTDLRKAVRHAMASVDGLAKGHLMRPMALMRASGALIGAAVLAGDRYLLRDAVSYTAHALDEVDPRFRERFRFVVLLGAAMMALHRLTDDPADLDSAISWLEQARRELETMPAHPQSGYCLINLARAYHMRGSVQSAVEAGLVALQARARDLLLQTGTDRSLHSARIAAAEASEVAAWCLACDMAEPAIQALELGRGLVLHSATSVSALPDLLAGAGRPDLAAAWCKSATTVPETPWDMGYQGDEYLAALRAGTSPLELPDDLRAKAFAALAGSVAEQRLLTPPSAAEMADALRETGADVLVYLLGPAAGPYGHAILVRAPDPGSDEPAAPEIVPLPWLNGDAVSVYNEAYAAVGNQARTVTNWNHPDQARNRAVSDWRRRLEEVCEWGWHSALLPILSVLHSPELNRPPRLVLIAAGALSSVPWHAAGTGSAESGTARYAVQDVVISYAASARQLVDAAKRPALGLTTNPVILGDPTNTLAGAIVEAEGIYDQCYPSGRYLGFTSPGWPGNVAGEGTPGQILRELPRPDYPGASVLHFGCHGRVVGSAPGRSHLVLAGRQELRVDAILRQGEGCPPSAPGGLVSLAACSSDLAGAEYDEALTPATAFLAAGATTVVGSRWEVPDDATSLLMFMFHFFMVKNDDSPRDALRRAQLWMLNPDREIPEEMPRKLTLLIDDSRLKDITAWAGFVHQGR